MVSATSAYRWIRIDDDELAPAMTRFGDVSFT